MLKIARTMNQLNFGALMEVYREGNAENGAEFFPDLPEGLQLIRAEQEFYNYLNECYFDTRGAVYAMWYENDVCVSALRLEPYQDGLLLEALETAPNRRRHGYARALIRAVIAWLGEQGRPRVYSHVSKRNKASLAVHASCGFRKHLDWAVYADGSVMRNSVTLVYDFDRR